ncbi:hypothetical protein AO066_05315 [Pseudomonas fluorescens]|nr:hypothetical protein AO066_05315 [Pseudomonas fluorescens]
MALASIAKSRIACRELRQKVSLRGLCPLIRRGPDIHSSKYDSTQAALKGGIARRARQPET